jgi:hypothetical protein
MAPGVFLASPWKNSNSCHGPPQGRHEIRISVCLDRDELNIGFFEFLRTTHEARNSDDQKTRQSEKAGEIGEADGCQDVDVCGWFIVLEYAFDLVQGSFAWLNGCARDDGNLCCGNETRLLLGLDSVGVAILPVHIAAMASDFSRGPSVDRHRLLPAAAMRALEDLKTVEFEVDLEGLRVIGCVAGLDGEVEVRIGVNAEVYEGVEEVAGVEAACVRLVELVGVGCERAGKAGKKEKDDDGERHRFG